MTEQIDWANVQTVPWVGRPSQLPDVRGVVDFDTETSGLHPDDGARVSVVSLGWVEGVGDWPCIRYVAFPFAQGKEGKPEEPAQLDLLGLDQGVNLPRREWDALCEWLSTRDALSGHHVKFDIPMVRAGVDGLRAGTQGWTGPDLTGLVAWDTQVVAKELWPTHPTALKGEGSVSHRLFGHVDREKQELKKHLGPKTNPRYDLVIWSVMEPYAAADGWLTTKTRLMEAQAVGRGEVAHGQCAGWYWVKRETEVLKVLARMERRGLPYDAAGSVDAARQVARRMDQIQTKLGLPVAKVKDYWFGRDQDGQPVKVIDLGGVEREGRGLEPYAVTEKKRDPQLTAQVLDDMVLDGIPGAELVVDYRKLESARNKWYTPYAAGIGGDGRLRTVFRQVASGFEGEGGTANGRFSVERVNLQAIPHDYRLLGGAAALEGIPTPRQLIGAAGDRLEGWELWEFDLAQAELRAAALFAKCERMLSAIREGRDLHGETTTELFQLHKSDAKWHEMRQVSKRGNFSLIFDSGWETFQAMVKNQAGVRLSNSEAQRIVSQWRRIYPEYKWAIDLHSRRIDFAPPGAKGMPLVNGRVRWWRGFEDTHKAFNARVQGSLAELGKDWMLETDRLGSEWDLDQRGKSDGVGCGGLLLTIHDSQVWLLPAAGAAAMSEQIVAAGIEVWDRLFPGVPGEIEAKRWGGAD